MFYIDIVIDLRNIVRNLQIICSEIYSFVGY